MKWPINKNDLPVITISAKNIKELNPGIGNIVGVQKEYENKFFEIKSSQISGTFQVKIFDLSADTIEKITTTIVENLIVKKFDHEKAGFRFLSMYSLGEIALLELAPEPLKNVMIRLIEYQWMFESVNKEIVDSEGIIKEINVRIDNTFDEEIKIKRKTD